MSSRPSLKKRNAPAATEAFQKSTSGEEIMAKTTRILGAVKFERSATEGRGSTNVVPFPLDRAVNVRGRESFNRVMARFPSLRTEQAWELVNLAWQIA